MDLLVESAIRATLLVIACAVVLFAARVRAPAVLHAVWAGVVFTMLIVPAWTLWGPRARIGLLPERARAAAATAPSLEADATSSAWPLVITARSGRVTAAVPERADLSGWRRGALLMYGTVALILFARLIVGTLRTRALIKGSSVCAGHRTSSACASPITAGWLRPVIILPDTWRDWPARKLDAVLTHEREHARRRHPFVQWLALVNRALFWFHPVAWWLPRHLSTLAEQTCDDAVLARGHDPRDYSQYLIETASDIGHAGGVRLAGVFMSGHQVSKRIRRILNEGRAPALSRTRGAAVVAMCVLACVATMGVTPIRASSQASIGSRLIIRPVQPRIAAPESPYPMSLEWLEGDEWAFEVQPIASSEELAAYGRLANIRERDAFIERFWAQRDPSPGTPVNEFRDEYQRRIAFGRRSFDTSSGLGFDTDRGRMYLMFGAPDSIETMDLRFDRFEMWRYTSIAGLGGDVRIRFSLSRDGYCGLRLVSPAPVQTRRTVGLSPLGLTAIAIPVDARTSTGVQYELRTRSGETIDQGAIGFIDTAGEPLIDHLPEEWFADGFGCTHALPTGSYTVATAVRRLDGEILRETVAFDVE